MDILKNLLQSITETNTTKLYEYIMHKNKRKDVKNITLIKAIKTDDINKITALYPDLKNNKSAYHALRKRLTDITLRFISEEILHHKHEQNDCKKQIELSQYLYQNHIPILAQKMLRKAEKTAINTASYLLLNEIYTIWLQHQRFHHHESLEILTQKLQENQYLIVQDNNLAIAYAHLSARIQQIQLQNKTINLTALITDTMSYYNIDLERALTLHSIVKILDIANEYAAIYQDYSLIELFIKKTHQALTTQHTISQEQIHDLLQTQYYIANYYLRIRNYEVSLSYLGKMQEIISADAKQYSIFQLKHDLLLSLNYFFTGKAIIAQSTLESSIISYKINSVTPDIIHDIYACLALITCMQQDNACLKYLSKLTQRDIYYEEKLGMLWVIKKNLMEIIAYIQFDYIDLAYSRITSFKRRYQLFLKQTGEERVLVYTKLLEQLLQQPQCVHTKKYQDKVNTIFNQHAEQDIFNSCFSAWICSQWSKDSPYETLLRLNNTDLQ